MLTALLRLFAKLPLAWLHCSGAILGWLAYHASPSYANRLRENLYRGGAWHDQGEYKKILKINVLESGKASAELAGVWFRPQIEVAGWVRKVNGWEVVEAARSHGRGLILLTPHIGCFEIISQYLSLKFPLTALYRSPRYAALEPAMRTGRTRPDMRLAPADVNGVRLLLKALRSGEAVGILPDQVPAHGDGEWADFFGRPAYTMTLAARLAQRTRAPVVITYAIRLPHGTGYELSFEPMPPREPEESPARQLNRALESVIRRFPEQYIWSYNRYKVPAGARDIGNQPA
jgi:KDO2-lipid IV(A) lauroyltransferase